MAQGAQLIAAQKDFTAGLVTTRGGLLCPKNGAMKLQNAMVHLGGFRKLYGTTKKNTNAIASKAVTSMYKAYVGAKSCLLASAGTVMYYSNDNGATWTSLITGLTENAPWTFVTINGYVFCTNGSDTERRIDITVLPTYAPTVTNMTGKPAYKCKVFFLAAGRVWAAINSTEPDTVYFCDVDGDGIATPETWPTANWLSFPTDSTSEQITGAGVWKDNPVIFTEHTLSLILGSNEFEFQQPLMDNRIGCGAYRTVANLGDDVVFMGKDRRIYLFDGGRVYCISDDIQPEITDINATYITSSHAVTDEYAYYLFYVSTAATGTVCNRMLMFDTRLNQIVGNIIKAGWTGPHTISAASAIQLTGTGDNGELYYGDSGATGFVHRFMDPTSTDFSTSAINMVVETRDWDFAEEGIGSLAIMKEFEEIITIAPVEGAYTVTPGYAMDGNTTFTDLTGISLVSVGYFFGDRDPTSATRTTVVYPSKLTASGTPRVSAWFGRFRWVQNGTGCACIINGYEIRASQARPVRR